MSIAKDLDKKHPKSVKIHFGLKSLKKISDILFPKTLGAINAPIDLYLDHEVSFMSSIEPMISLQKKLDDGFCPGDLGKLRELTNAGYNAAIFKRIIGDYCGPGMLRVIPISEDELKNMQDEIKK